MDRICRSGILFAGHLIKEAALAAFKPKYIKKILPLFVTASLVISTISPAAVFATTTEGDTSGDCGSNLIANGSFELPVVGTPEYWDIYAGDGVAVPGWQAKWMKKHAPEDIAKIELQSYPLNDWTAQDGNQWTELDTDYHHPSEPSTGDDKASINLFQDITGLTPGRQYTFSFYTAPRPGHADNHIQVKWDGHALGAGDGEIMADGSSDITPQWENHTYTVTASSETVRVEFMEKGEPDSYGMLLDMVSLLPVCPPAEYCDFREDSGWYGEYFNYLASHEDMNIDSDDWPDATHGDPLNWTDDTDWYTEPYFRFSRVDANLLFGDNFFPFGHGDGATPIEEDNYNGEDYHFGAHWSAKVTVASEATDHNFTLTSDDDAWVYLDGVLVADNAGIHEPSTINGSMNFGGTHIVDVYYAERHTVRSHMFFAFTGDERMIIQPYNSDCVQPIPELVVTKTGKYDSETGQIAYDINWEVNGDGTLYSAQVIDTLPAGTTFVSSDFDPDYTDVTGGVVTWNLGDITAEDDGTIRLVVSLDSYDPWADTVVSYNPGTQKEGGGALPDDRNKPDKALHYDEDTDAAPINFVSLGFEGELVL